MDIAEIILSAIAAGGIIVGALWYVFSLHDKVNRIDRSVKALVMIHSVEMAEFYKDNVASLYNPQPNPERDELLAKLDQGTLTIEEINKLERILKWEETEAKRKDQQKAVIAIGGMLILLYLLSKK